MDEESRVEISVTEYHELLRMAERVAAVERFFAKSKYVCTEDIKIILDIKEPVTMGANDGEF